MSKRVFLLLVIIILLAIGVGFTTLETSSMQSDMNNFENELVTGNGVTTTINNSSFLGDVALKIQSVIDLIMGAFLTFLNKLISIFN
ncbi:MAG: hypothetical protein R3Y05_00205 [bacterium]